MGRRGLVSCEGCIRMEENNRGWYAKNSVEPVIEGVKAAETLEYDNTVTQKEFRKTWINEKKECGRMYEQVVIGMLETTDEQETWRLRKTNLKVETEDLLFTAQEQAIRANHVKHKIDKTDEPPLCKMCGKAKPNSYRE